ncbi:MAG TPA: hypothetical protein VIV60_27710 [Polyangiaceae bacterium]
MTYVSLLVPLMVFGFSLSFFRTTTDRPSMRYLIQGSKPRAQVTNLSG